MEGGTIDEFVLKYPYLYS